MDTIVAEHARLLDAGLDVDLYTSRQLATSASCYLDCRCTPWPPPGWDIDPAFWQLHRYPEDRRLMITKAGALYLAAADRAARGGTVPGAGETTCRGLAGYCAEVLDRGLLPAGASR